MQRLHANGIAGSNNCGKVTSFDNAIGHNTQIRLSVTKYAMYSFSALGRHECFHKLCFFGARRILFQFNYDHSFFSTITVDNLVDRILEKRSMARFFSPPLKLVIF
jgi:hypothetical protein